MSALMDDFMFTMTDLGEEDDDEATGLERFQKVYKKKVEKESHSSSEDEGFNEVPVMSLRQRRVSKALPLMTSKEAMTFAGFGGQKKLQPGVGKALWKTAFAKIKAMKLKDPWADFKLEEIETEAAKRFRYSAYKKKWIEDEVEVKMEKKPFSRGALRQCFRLKKLSTFSRSRKWSRAGNYVAKKYLEVVDDKVYYDDICLQMDSKLWAEEYNKHNPPKKIDIFQVALLVFKDRPNTPIYHLEHFIEGNYVKYNSNSGYVEETHRLTPQAFSHFTFERSGHVLMVVDIQGVGDLYTDPSIHTADGVMYGEGNLGTKGMALFFHSHACNSICKSMALSEFDLSPNETANLDSTIKRQSLDKNTSMQTTVRGVEEMCFSPRVRTISESGAGAGGAYAAYHELNIAVPFSNKTRHRTVSSTSISSMGSQDSLPHDHDHDHDQDVEEDEDDDHLNVSGRSGGGGGGGGRCVRFNESGRSSAAFDESGRSAYIFAERRSAAVSGVDGYSMSLPDDEGGPLAERDSGFGNSFSSAHGGGGLKLGLSGLDGGPVQRRRHTSGDSNLSEIWPRRRRQTSGDSNLSEESLTTMYNFHRPRPSCVADELSQFEMREELKLTGSILGKMHHDLVLYHEIGRFCTDENDQQERLQHDSDANVDWESAVFHERIAAELGEMEAVCTLAKVYLDLPRDNLSGYIVEPTEANIDIGVDYMLKAAQAGDRAAMIYMAKAFETGIGLGSRAIDWSESADWYSQALEMTASDDSGCYDSTLDDPKWQLLSRQAELYAKGGHDLEQDVNKAAELFSEAGELASAAMKGRMANKFFARAEELWAEIEE